MPRIDDDRSDPGGCVTRAARASVVRERHVPPRHAQATPARQSWGGLTRPARALAATTSGLASSTRPGPLRPGKLRLPALIVTSSADSDMPGPAAMHAP